MGVVRRGPLRPALTAAALLCGLTFLVSACGDSDSGTSKAGGSGSATAAASAPGADSAGVTAAKQAVATATKLTTDFPEPGPALKGAKAAFAGKTVWYVPITAAPPFFGIEAKTMADALGRVGAKVHVCDGKVNPSSASACLTQAANAGAAGIITDAMPVQFAQQAYATVVNKKIPIVASQLDLPVPTTGNYAKYLTSVDGNEVGVQTAAADMIIADSGGKANIVANNSTDTPSSVIAAAAAFGEIKKNCPGCKLKTFDSTQTSAHLGSAVSSAILSTPAADYFYAPYEAPSGTVIVQGIRQAAKKLKFVASSGDPSGLLRVEGGTQLADAGSDPVNLGWNAVDALLRLGTGAPAVKHHTIMRLFTKDNVPTHADAAGWASGSWYSNGGFKDMYLKLWGVSGS